MGSVRCQCSGGFEDNYQQRDLDNLLEQFLQASRQTLNDLCIHGAYPLTNFLHLPLINLTKMRVIKNSAATEAEMWNFIASIDYKTQMPQLMNLEISLNTLEWMTTALNIGRAFYTKNEAANEWPIIENGGPSSELGCCTSVRILKLDVNVQKINLELLKSVFPNVSRFELTVNHTTLSETDLPSIAGIQEFWPNLEELVLTGEDDLLVRNYDGDFCGISEEELEFLRKQDDEFLKAIPTGKFCTQAMQKAVPKFCAQSGPLFVSKSPA